MTSLLLTALMFVPTRDASEMPSDTQQSCRLQGEWFLVQTRDEKRVEAGSEQIRMTVARDGSTVFTFQGIVTNRGSIELTFYGKASRLNLRMPDGRTFKGHSEVRDADLTICFDEVAKGRPSGIEPRGTQWTEHWKRIRR